jgi:hypothetical protein
MFISCVYLHQQIKTNTMTTTEINTNIARLENTIKMNIWNKGYVANCKAQIENYKLMLN